MSVLKNRKTLKAFAHKIFAQQALLDDEMLLVARALEAIGDGADANRAFGVNTPQPPCSYRKGSG